MLDTLAWVRAAVGLEAPVIAEGVEHRIMGIMRDVNYDRAWVIKEPMT